MNRFKQNVSLRWTVPLVLAVACWLLPHVCEAQVVAIAVRSCAAGRSCRIVRCSGVVIGQHDGHWIALSAGHSFLDSGQASVVRVFLNGDWHDARLLSFSVTRDEDLAVLELDYTGDLKAAPLFHSETIDATDRLSVKAFAQGTNYREREARILSATKVWFSSTGLPLQGESGGGIFLGEQLVAIVKGYPTFGQISTIGTNSNRIRVYLRSTLGAVPLPPAPKDTIAEEGEAPAPLPPAESAAPRPPTGKDPPASAKKAPPAAGNDVPATRPDLPNSSEAQSDASPPQERPDQASLPPSGPRPSPTEPPRPDSDRWATLNDRLERLTRGVEIAMTAARYAGYIGAGGTGLAGAALLVSAGRALWRWRRRRSFRAGQTTDADRDTTDGGQGLPCRPSAAPQSTTNVPLPRELDETREFLQLRQRENRVAPLDALRGVLVDDELEHEIVGQDPRRAEWARELKHRLDERTNDIAPLSTHST